MVMNYGGSSPMMPGSGAPSDGDPIISSGAPIGPVSAVTQNQVDVNLFKAKMYEEDGDSILGSLLPNVYIKKVTLQEASSADSKLVDRDPHIKTGYPDQNELIADALSSGDNQPLKVNIDLVIKEKVENDDVSLFTIENITKALRLRVMLGLNKNCINMIKTAGNTINYENPQEVGKLISGDLFPGPTTASPFFPFTYNIGPDGLSYKGQDMLEYRYIDIPLSDLPQFKAVINEVVGSNSKQNQEDLSAKFLLSLNKEILSDGTRLYHIPVTVPSIEIPSALGGTNIKDLTVFAVSYIDYNTLIDLQEFAGSNNTLDFVNSKKDQFANVGYNTTAFSVDKIAQYFEEFMEDYGSGLAAIKNVIKDKKIANTNDIFVYSDTDDKYQSKYGKKWSGPVHYHGQNNKGPNGYIGYMGGTTGHMGTDKPTPKLIKTKMVSDGEILDYRNKKLIDELILNYADFGFDNNFKELVSPVPPSLQKTGTEALYERETKSNSWLKAKQQKMFSDPMFSLRQDGSCAFLFTLDLDKIIRYNTILPGLYQTLPLQEYVTVLSGLKIESLKIFRHEVSNSLDNRGMPYIDESEQVPVLIAEATAKLDNKLSGAKKNTGLIQTISLNDGDSVGVFLRHIMVTDLDIKKQKSNRKKYQYSVEVVAQDPVIDYLKNKVTTYIAPLKNTLRDYFQFATSTKGYFDVHSNTFTNDFREAFEKSGFSGPGGTINTSFLQGIIGTSMQSFLNNFLFKFKNFSTSEKIDISSYMSTLAHPLHGNPSGINVVLKHVELFEKKILDLIDIQSSTVGFKSKGSRQEVMFERLQAKGGKPPKNQISIQTLLDGSFDSNHSGEVGYTYIPAPANLGLLKISQDQFLARILLESGKYSFSDIDTDNLGIAVSDVASQNLRYLTPTDAKTISGKRLIGVSKEDDVETLISILETNTENTSGADDAAFEIDSDTAEAPDLLIGNNTYPSLKKKIPNMLRVLENADISITNKGANLPLIYNPSSMPSIKASPAVVADFNSVVKTGVQAPVDNLPSGIKKISEQITDATDIKNSLTHFPTTTKDASQLVATLMTMQKVDVSDVNKIIVSLLFIANKLGSLPNQIKKVISDVLSAQQGNALGEFKINYDNFVNMSSIALAHGNLVELEYFEKFGQFGLLSIDIKDKRFKPLTSEVLTSLQGSDKKLLLVRMKPYSGFNIVNPTDNARLPIFNEYFLLKLN
jgi:hypothetical protein